MYNPSPVWCTLTWTRHSSAFDLDLHIDLCQVNELIVNTVETERQRYFLNKFVLQHKPVLFVGPTGTGKSAITNNFLLQLPKGKYTINNVVFSARTSSNQTQDIILSKLDRFVFLKPFWYIFCAFSDILSRERIKVSGARMLKHVSLGWKF